MSDAALTTLGVLELAGLVALFVLVRRSARRREAGLPRAPRPIRILTALFGLWIAVGFPVVMILAVVNPTLQADRLREELQRTGTRATAVVNHIEETGTVINLRPEVRVSMTVRPQNAPPFNSQSTWVFSVSDVQAYRAGVKLNVLFDPKDHARVTVVGVAP